MIGWTVFENLKSFEFVPISAITLISNLPNLTYFEKPLSPLYICCLWAGLQIWTRIEPDRIFLYLLRASFALYVPYAISSFSAYLISCRVFQCSIGSQVCSPAFHHNMCLTFEFFSQIKNSNLMSIQSKIIEKNHLI